VTSSQVAAASAAGLVRGRNEDSAYVGHCLCAVADGMGGHAAGDVASATVIAAIRPFDSATDALRLTAALGSAVTAANQQLAVKAKADQALASMGSTLTAMLWSGSYVAIAHIGDSRAYRLRNHILQQVTEDHVLSKLVAAPMPACIGGYLVRYLDARPGWSPDLTLHTVRPGDRYLICSDGLSGFVGPDAIRDVLADGDIDQVPDSMVRLAYEAGAPDNVTVIAVDVPDGSWQERNGSPLALGAAGRLAGRP
jgi:serine/threonine protein phosphatase PrpC